MGMSYYFKSPRLSWFYLLSPLVLLFSRCTSEPSGGGGNTYSTSNYESTCVDLMEIFPVPNSVLKPISEKNDFSDYLFHFWYSHPFVVHTAPIAYLSISLTSIIVPQYAAYYGESESSMITYFRIPSNLKIARLVS